MNGDVPIGTFINLPSETHLNKCSTVCNKKCFIFSVNYYELSCREMV